MHAPSTQTIIDSVFKMLGIAPEDTLNALYSLYNKGYISYPRTESTSLDKDHIKDVPAILFSIFQSNYHDVWITKYLLEIDSTSFKDGVLDDDSLNFVHRAITPTERLVDKNNLTDIEERVNAFVISHYLLLFNTRE